MRSGTRVMAVSGWMAMVAMCVVLPATAGGQQWNDERVMALVRQATLRRAEQLADSGLTDYSATAHGYVTFLAQFGEGFREPPQVVKADELELEVYWHAPNLSKQRIVGRRDTTLLPTDIQYHRDHLGIVQNNFPAIIRLGEGDEVRDVPHPLSASGLADYDFALSDSLRITIPGRVIAVYEVKVRPKNDREPRVIGAVYIDRDNGAVVRMALSFTRAAFLDKQLEDLFVVLENGLVGTRFWLPRRQDIEIRRTATWLDYPARGIIRGRWEIGNYALNPGVPPQTFLGPEIVQTPAARQPRQWTSANILDSLPPDVRAVTADEIRRVQAEARSLVRAQALQRARGSALAARGVSDLIRFNRAEGLAVGAGWTLRLGQGLSATAQGRYGLDDRAMKGRGELRWENANGASLRAFALDEFRDVGDVPERSLVANSLAAQEVGSDDTDPFGVRALGAAVGARRFGFNWTLEGARERQRALQVRSQPAEGRFEGTVPAKALTSTRVTLVAERPTSLWMLGLEGRARFEAHAYAPESSLCSNAAGPCDSSKTTARVSADVEVEREIGGTRLVSRTIAAAVRADGSYRVQELVFLGGPVSAPGYDFHSLVGRAALSQRVELQLPVPFPAVSLGRFGHSGARATLAPFAAVAFVSGVDSTRLLLDPALRLTRSLNSRGGVYPSVGAGLLTLFDLLRFDVARGLHDGRWTFSVDVNRSFWRIL